MWNKVLQVLCKFRFWMFKFWKHIAMAEDFCCPNPSSGSLKVCGFFLVGSPWGQGHAGQPPTVGYSRHRRGGWGAGGQRRHWGEWRRRWGQRLNANICAHAHTHTVTRSNSTFPQMDWPPIHYWPHSSNQEQRLRSSNTLPSAHKHRQNHRGQFVHTEPSSPSIFPYNNTNCDPRLLHYPFSTEICSLSVASGRKICEYLHRPMCEWVYMWERVCICCVFVTLYVFVQVWEMDTLWTGGHIIWALFLRGRWDA